jgi:hypothetical protein
MDSTSGSFATLLVAVLITVLVFLVLRALVLWYWKVNEIVDRLKSIDSHLASLAGAAGTVASPSDSVPRGATAPPPLQPLDY